MLTATTIIQKKTGFAILLSLTVLLHSAAATAQWRFDPVLRAAYDFDDNATLSGRTDSEVELSGYILEGSVDMSYRSARNFFTFRPMVRSRDYGSNEQANSDDQFAEFFGLFQGDRNSLRIFGDASREAVRTAERAEAGLDTNIDPDEIEDDQSGIVFLAQRRERLQVTPRWTHRLSATSAFETDFRYLTVSYDEGDTAISLFGFDDMRLGARYRRTFSPRNVGTIEISAREFDSDRIGGDRNTYSLNAGFVRSLSETSQLRVRVGVESVEREAVGAETDTTDTQPLLDITVIQQLETIRLLAQYRQRVNSSGQGVLTRRDELNLRFTRDLTETFSAGLGVRAYSNETVSGTAIESDYVQLRGQVVWRLSRTFSIQADYRHTIIDRDIVEGAADSNRLTLWLSYQPNPVGRDPRLDVRL